MKHNRTKADTSMLLPSEREFAFRQHGERNDHVTSNINFINILRKRQIEVSWEREPENRSLNSVSLRIVNEILSKFEFTG
jgi:hypothetical protein